MVSLFLSAALLALPAVATAQDPGCGECEDCSGMDYYRVYACDGDPECDEDYVATGGDCVHRAKGCEQLFACPYLEDEDFEDIEELANALKLNDSATISAVAASYGRRLTLHQSRRGAILFGGCNNDVPLSFVPLSDAAFNVLSDAGLVTPEHYLEGLSSGR
jgi:hypothetical protein